jgi:hypothetical protein
LWTTDERSAPGRINGEVLRTNTSTHYISRSGSSITYVSAIAVGETVTMLWQAERADGNNDLVGTQISLDEYERLFV